MRTRRPQAVLFAGIIPILLAGVTALGIAAPGTSHPRVASTDVERRLDLNQLNMAVTNFGPFAYGVGTGLAGLIFPRGQSTTVLFASGLWIGCRVGGATRVALSEYGSEYGPGSVTGGFFEDPHDPALRVYKVARYAGSPDDTAHVERTAADLAADPHLDTLGHHSWSEYLAGAASHGAPTRTHRLPDTSTPSPDDSVDVPGPDVLGDWMTWAVYNNDADPARHIEHPGRTAPLGVIVQQTSFAFDRLGPLGNTIFLRFKIIDAGPNRLEDAYVGLWCDPDLGGASDDLVGCQRSLALGYCYNATNSDFLYGSSPPAVGYQLLRGPRAATGEPIGLYAFYMYANGTDPANAAESYNHLRGLLPTGSPVIDPTTAAPTRYFDTGDPVQGTGWVDGAPGDRRMLLSAGPFTMAPGDTQEVWAAIVVSRGVDRLDSISRLLCDASYIRDVFDAGFPDADLPQPPCNAQISCPRPPSWWRGQCEQPTLLAAAQMESIAACVNQSWTSFDWPTGASLASFCSGVAGDGDARARAKSEFLALAATACAGRLGIRSNDKKAILISPAIAVSCPGLAARNVNELLRASATVPQFLDAEYQDRVADHGVPIEGVAWGGRGFGGGADVANSLFGSTLEPVADPDSFGTVRLDFTSAPSSMAYRFLRLERTDGGPPPQGRAYLYGGFHPVRFTARDSATGEPLDVAFVERCVTDDQGTILPPASQVATFDSTWAPDITDMGGREYLLVLKRPYGSAPKPSIARDGAVLDASLPMLYALWARRRAAEDDFDAGDAFVFRWGLPTTPGVDAELVRLENQPLADPEVQQVYANIVACLSSINHGIGIGPVCDEVTPVLGSLVSARAEPDRALVTWRVVESGGPVVVQRGRDRAGWIAVASLRPSASGEVAYEDRNVLAGARYGYRLSLGGTLLGEVWLEIPATHALSLAGLRPNPAGDRLIVSLSLATAEPAVLELFDVHGRRLIEHLIEDHTPGPQRVDLGRTSALPPGLYLVRLAQGKRQASGKAVVVR